MCEYVSNWYLYECFKRSLDYFKKLYFSITLLSNTTTNCHYTEFSMFYIVVVMIFFL